MGNALQRTMKIWERTLPACLFGRPETALSAYVQGVHRDSPKSLPNRLNQEDKGMEQEERPNNQAPEVEGEETPGVMLLGFVAGLGLAFLGLFFVLTGIGALIGVGLIILGGLLSAFSGLWGELREWLARRRKRA